MARKRTNSADLFATASAIADAIHEQDQVVAAQSERERGQRTKLPLLQIKNRSTDTRPLDSQHVADLAESIAALGLIEPLVVDTKGVLLAGGHRLAALQVLQETEPKMYAQRFPDGQVQVHVLEFDAKQEPERALQVELAENEKRVNYTRDQIERLAERLRSLNYRDVRGRPKAGEKALGPALAVAIGVSARYVRKVLSGQKQELSDQKNRNSVPIFQKLKLLKKIESALEELSELPEVDPSGRSEKALLKALPAFLSHVQGTIKHVDTSIRQQQ